MIITLEAFESSLDQHAPPAHLSLPLKALWWDRNGDWDEAHRCAQDDPGSDGAWVHAYLHRVEGDLGNAGYWYRRAGKPLCDTPLQQEWREILVVLLAQE